MKKFRDLIEIYKECWMMGCIMICCDFDLFGNYISLNYIFKVLIFLVNESKFGILSIKLECSI